MIGEGQAWSSVLARIGWPTDTLVIDFETYFDTDYTLTKLSTIEYIEDPRFEFTGVATKLNEHRAAFWPDVPEAMEWCQAHRGMNLEGCTVVMFNANFDGTILARKFGIIPPYLIDVRDLSRHLDARNDHHLKDVARRLGLPPKGNTMQFLGRRWKDMTVEERTAMAKYAADGDAVLEYEAFKLLLPRIANPEIELPLAWHTHRLFWCPELQFDFDFAADLIAQMDAQIVADSQEVEHTRAELSGTSSFVAILGEVLAETGETVPMKQGKKKFIPALAKTDKAAEALRTHKNVKVRNLMRARAAIKSWPLHQARLQRMIAQARRADGMLPNPLNYYGCHTGRWSGGEGINTYNLPSRGGGLKCEMKKCLVAPPGMILVMADAAQIEARGTGWIAGESKITDAFAQGRDVYSELATDVFGYPVRKSRKDDPKQVADFLDARRAIGKVGILGMGYGMAALRALVYMEGYPELRDQLKSGEIDLEFCEKLVEKYRGRYDKIPKFWRTIENAWRVVAKYGQAQAVGPLRLHKIDGAVRLRLPSGRNLWYHDAKVNRDGELSWRWGRLWGGVLTENIVQAMSRDVLAEALLAIEAEGFRVVHHVYDSIVVSVEEGLAEAAEACVRASLTKVPAWASGWPLGVDSWTGERYK